MSVVFLLLGLTNLIILFYGKDKVSKFFWCLTLSLFLISFFIGEITYANLGFNIFVIIGTLILFIYLSLFNKLKFIDVSYIIIVNFLYYLLVKFNDIYLTVFKPMPMIILCVGLSIIMFKDVYKITLINLIAFLFIEAKNCLHLLENFGFANIFNIEFVTNLCFVVFISVVIKCLLNITTYLKRRNINAYGI